uniref:HTH_48 domain-containing protein n=1 Tax=Strongyloides papillosus TaxID=174720 RepID=A0A0N5C2K5_STREA
MSIIYCYLFYIFSIFSKLNSDIVVFESAFKAIENRYFWYYDYTTFASKEDFLEHIGETYPEFISKLIFIRITGEFNVLGEFIRYDPVKLCKICLPQKDKPKSRVGLKRVQFSNDEVIVRYSLNGEITYECDGHIVPTLQELAKCALKKRHQKFGSTCQKTSYRDEALVCTIKQSRKNKTKSKLFCENIDVIQLLNYRKGLKKSTFSDKIWSSIWKNRYSYGCFSLHNYRLLKERYIREINAYRSFYKVSPLTEDFKLTQLAQTRAMVLANYGELSQSRVGLKRVQFSNDEVIVKVFSKWRNYI